MGQRASDTRGISFEDVEVPAEVIIYASRQKLFSWFPIDYGKSCISSYTRIVRTP